MVEHKKQLPVYSDTSGCLLIQVGIKYDVMVVRTVRVCGALEAGEGTDTAGYTQTIVNKSFFGL